MKDGEGFSQRIFMYNPTQRAMWGMPRWGEDGAGLESGRGEKWEKL